jgi:hypothetical protein
MKRSYSLVIAMIALMFLGLGFAPESFADEGMDAQAQAALSAAIEDAKTRAVSTKDQRFAFTTRVETGDEENPIVEFAFDPQQPEEQQFRLIHPTAQENAKAREKIIEQRQKALNKRRKAGETAAPDRDLIVDLSSGFLENQTARFLRETPTEYIFSHQPAEVGMNFGGGDKKDDKDKKRSAKQSKEKNQSGNFAKHMSGEIAISKADQRFVWIRIYATKSFKPVPVAKIKTFEMLMQLAPAWPGGPLVKTRQEVSVVGKALFKKFEQHSIIDSFAFEKR